MIMPTLRGLRPLRTSGAEKAAKQVARGTFVRLRPFPIEKWDWD